MKAVLISIQPYWVFLIIAKAMCWNIEKEKTVEVRKNYPKAEAWDKIAKIYCSKDKKSFDRIPKEYQPLMKPLLGKVIGEFVCDDVAKVLNNICVFSIEGKSVAENNIIAHNSCLDFVDMKKYLGGKDGYAWHISDLVIYDKPKELSEFKKINRDCWYANLGIAKRDCPECQNKECFIQRPPQSWCYVESEVAE